MQSIGKLGIISLGGNQKFVDDICKQIFEMRKKEFGEMDISSENEYKVKVEPIRFSSGESKVIVKESIRGKDIYIIADVTNYSCEYEMYGFINRKGPNEHFQDIISTLSAIAHKARRVTVVMPYMISSRQHKRKTRESLDCAVVLQTLERMGVNAVLTYEIHDPTVQNSLRLMSFENLHSSYDLMNTILKTNTEINNDKQNTLVISPDTGGMDRCIYYASILGLDVGVFYKRRDYKHIVKGKAPILAHEYLGKDIEGQNILIIDDMIASGESVIDIIKESKNRGAKSTNIIATFGLFTEGKSSFDNLYEQGLLNKIYCTNLNYVPQNIRTAPWFVEVDMSTSLAKIIHRLNFDRSISHLLNKSNINTEKNIIQESI